MGSLLDREKEPSPILLRAMHEVLLRMCTISNAKARAYDNVRVSLGKAGSSSMPGRLDSPQDYWYGRWTQCRIDRERLEVIRGAQDCLRALLYAPRASLRHGTLEWKRAVATEALEEDGTYSVIAREVGGRFGISQSYVRMLRRALREGRLEVEEAA